MKFIGGMHALTRGLCLVFLAALCCAPAARAADPQPYAVELAPTGDGALDATLLATSELVTLRGKPPVSPYGLIARARGDVDRLKIVLESYGYYQSSVGIIIDGRGLREPGLADALSALPGGRDARVSIGLQRGPQYHLGRITIEGELPASAEGLLGLSPGAPALAANVQGAGTRLLSGLKEQGYAFAKVDPPIAYEDATHPVLDVTFHVEVGPKVRIGEIRIEGLQHIHEAFVRRRLLLHSGEQYSSSALERSRRDLLGLGVFTSVIVSVGTVQDASGGVPVTFQIHERPRKAVNLNTAFSSDLGGSAGVTWTDRNLLGNAEQLSVSATALNLGGGSASNGVGYDTGVKYIMPDFGRRDQSLQFSVGAIKQSLEAYDQTALTTGVTLVRKLSKVWTVSAGVSSANEQVIQPTGAYSVTHDYTLVALPVGASYDSTDLASPLDDPLHGMRDSVNIAPTRSLGQTSATFVVSQLKLAAYFDLSRWFDSTAGRSVLATRVLAGWAQGAGEYSLPPDQRFYGGGAGTIRGYSYQSVGPQFHPPINTPIGGTAISAVSAEFRQRLGGNWGAALFADSGQVSSSLRLLSSSIYTGVGAGVRYYTPIGPIRFDMAVPTKRNGSSTDNYEFYIGIGQAF